MLAGAFHQPEHVKEILGDVVILLEEQHHARVVSGYRQLIEYSISLPPPVMLRLGELRLTVVAVEIRMLGIRALKIQGSVRQKKLIN